MRNSISRLIALVAITVSLVAPAIPAHADTDQNTEHPDIVFDVFPHQGQGVDFWNSWGARRSGGRRHQGIDIMSPRGTSIVAVADGVVTSMGWHRMSGYFIRVQHEDGWMSVYMHLNNDRVGTDDGEGGPWSAFSLQLKEGYAVHAGEVIGYVGDSGNAEGTKPHTHFELRVGEGKVNPHTYLKDVWERQQRLINETGAAV
jgi:murein DD-endopeptidase MepM/ murein hydrolase activator NlpD